ncbi:MAG: helix-turn-helix transcriptional regulator [Clostridia bacterium]|nr:helix-turn-helix transcriptional regulator [Clostridia bacterium]
MNTFGDNLKAIRTTNRISQKKFAEMIGTTQQRVSEWERGLVEPTLYNIIKIIKVLNVSFEELIDGI